MTPPRKTFQAPVAVPRGTEEAAPAPRRDAATLAGEAPATAGVTPASTEASGPGRDNPVRVPEFQARIGLLNLDHPALNLQPPLALSGAGDDAAAFHLHREWVDCEVVARFTVDGEPTSKARARFTSYGSKVRTYTPEKTTQAEQVIGWKFRAAARSHRPDKDTTYGVIALFFAGTRQRRDVDNMLKAVLDGLNGIAWADDSQVVEVSARKTYDPVNPDWARTEVVVYRVGTVRQRTAMCSYCGRDYATYECFKERQRYCSQKCAGDARRTIPREAVCPGCKIEFVKENKSQVYCSPECRGTRVSVACTACGQAFTKQRCYVRKTNYCSADCRNAALREHRTKRPKGTCATCGGPTSKKSYRECQACALNSRPVSGKPQLPGGGT